MTRDETITLLRRHADDIRGFAVTGLYLFGSTARGEAEPSSDVDLFVDYDEEEFDFVKLIRLQEYLSHLLGRKVDLMTRRGLHPLIRDDVVSEAIPVFQ
ncbi:MAG: nucleotidyltransferase family protein [Rhodoplanes sp.]|jgi:predicted nucleotidyltransferase